MDINKDEINPNKRWCLCKKKGIVGSKGNRFKNKSGWGGAPPPAMRTKREAHRHKSQNKMWAHGSCMFWNVLVTNLCGSDLHLNSVFLQRVPNEAKNDAKKKGIVGSEARTRPENSFGNPSALAAQQHFARCPWWLQAASVDCTHGPSFLPSFLPSFHPSLGSPLGSPLASFPPSLLPSFPPFLLPSFPPFLLSSFPPSFLPSLLPSFLPSLLASFPPFLLPSFLPSFLSSFPPSLLPSFPPYFLPSFLPSFSPFLLPSFPPSLLSSFPPFLLPSFLPSLLPSFPSSFLPSFPPSLLSSFPPFFMVIFFDAFIFFVWCIFIFFDASPHLGFRLRVLEDLSLGSI